jgi:hypothetical protein
MDSSISMDFSPVDEERIAEALFELRPEAEVFSIMSC